MTDEATITTQQRLCFRCYERKPLAQFSLSTGGSDGHGRECRLCRSNRDRKKYAAERGKQPGRAIEPVCKCPLEWHDGVLYEMHGVSCPEMHLFNQINLSQKATRSSLEAANGLYGL